MHLFQLKKAAIGNTLKANVKGSIYENLVLDMLSKREISCHLSRGAALNTEHLKARLVQSDAWKQEDEFTLDNAKDLLCSRFDTMDFEQAKEDVRPFIKDTGSLSIWSADFFKQITDNLK